MKEEAVNYSVFTIKDENGIEKECKVLFTFDSKETNKSYIVYTDESKTSDGSLKVYANIYDKSGNNKNLFPIETEEEWNTIESILAKLEEKSEEKK